MVSLLSRLSSAVAVSLSCLVYAVPALAQSRSGEELVIVTWGGSLGDQMREVLFRPFTAKTSIRVREDTGPQIERSRAEVQSGKPSYDTTATNLAFYLIGQQQNLWAPVDYGSFDKVSGSLNFDPPAPEKSSVTVVNDADGMAAGLASCST